MRRGGGERWERERDGRGGVRGRGGWRGGRGKGKGEVRGRGERETEVIMVAYDRELFLCPLQDDSVGREETFFSHATKEQSKYYLRQIY